MTIQDWLQNTTKQLSSEGIPSARLDCLILIEDTLRKDRAWILSHPEYTLAEGDIDILDNLAKRRAKHEPLAYIRGRSEFYGREFIVSPATLQPRPETETMIELLLKYTANTSVSRNIIDIGTGSGCLAITAKLELPDTTVYATDINHDALIVAKKNVEKFNTEVRLLEDHLLNPASELLKNNELVVLANLPYVPDGYTINQSAMQEPAVAIFGGIDGLDLYREMFKQFNNLIHKPRLVFTESLPFQHDSLEVLATDHNYRLTDKQDLIQVFILDRHL